MLRQIDLTILSEAAARGVPLVLSVACAGAPRHYKSRFLKMSGDGLWIESVPEAGTLLLELAGACQAASVAVKSERSKFLFTTLLLSGPERFHLHAGGRETVAALRLGLPQELKTIQRRAAYRTRVRPMDLSARAWRIGPEAVLTEEPPELQQLGAEPIDISVGGLGILLRPLCGQAPVVTPGERLRVELISEEGTVLLEGRLRGGGDSEEADALLAGIQWVLPHDSRKSAQLTIHLEKLVNRLQRQELRRGKLPAAGRGEAGGIVYPRLCR
jgi:hypothetical protein